MPDMNAEQLIQALGLSPHPSEGGFFRETYRAELPIPPDALPAAYAGAARAASTAIYYLLTPDAFSAMHRLPGDEIFHFYLGDPVEMLQLRDDGSGEVVVLGQVLAAGMRPQVVVPGGVWQGWRPLRAPRHHHVPWVRLRGLPARRAGGAGAGVPGVRGQDSQADTLAYPHNT
jgi:predicted cupin superfamily sugar epimerase